MREKLQLVYGKKAQYYLDILDAFEAEEIHCVLLNLLVSDDNPGDLDIIFYNGSYKSIRQILMNHGYLFYTKYETDQYLWNKYIKGIGFVQVHCYLSFSFQRKNYLKGYHFSGNETNNPTFQFYVFLIESYYKHKRRDEQYRNYLGIEGKEKVLDFSKHLSKHAYIICSQMLDEYNTKRALSVSHIINLNIECILRRFRMFLSRKNRRVLFIGVDGAGKSSIVDGVYKIFSKGGIFPKKIYLGLRNSKLNRAVKEQERKQDVSEGEKNPLNLSPKGILRFIKLLLYWFEYNFRYVALTYIPNSAPTVYLIDRCYIDLLRYYHSGLAEWLFLKASLYPRDIVLLIGDLNTIYERKKEFSMKEFESIYDFYSVMRKKIESKNRVSLLTIDTTSQTLDDSIIEVCDYIMR